jgi:transglutaminase-like putative cysteine protease
MLLLFNHTTDLQYDEPIGESVMELRVCPTQSRGQRRLAFDLHVTPPATPTSYNDWQNNVVHALTVNQPHRRVRVRATSLVETQAAVDPVKPLMYPVQPAVVPFALQDFLSFGGPIVRSDKLREHADSIEAKPGEPISHIADRLMWHVFDAFKYESGATTAASPITDLLEGGRGVCQDFTHLTLGLARLLGIPARYVSGLVHPISDETRGFTQTHAWVELLAGDPTSEHAWFGIDPTNNARIGENYVRVAVGRDYRDVPPNKGVWRGRGEEQIDVRVESEELTEMPAEVNLRRQAVPDAEVPYAPPPGWSDRESIDPYSQAQQQQQ